MYYGLSLQLLTYLDVVVSNALQLIDLPGEVGGMLYFHVHRPFISHDVEDVLKREDVEETVLQMQQEKYKMTGYLPADYEVVHLSDNRLAERAKSDIVPITLKKDGSFSAVGNSTLSTTDIQTLRQYTNRVIEQSATKITQGSLEINPTYYGQSKACDFCQYRSICQFDVDFLGNKPRLLPKLKGEMALENMKCQLEGGESDEC